MAARGRKSAASLSVVAFEPAKRLPPPNELTSEQAAIWRDITATKPVEWFNADNAPLLSAYCRAVVNANFVAVALDAFHVEWLATDEGVKRYDVLTRIAGREAHTITTLATKLRLSNQSRYDPKTAARADARTGGATKPWEFGAAK